MPHGITLTGDMAVAADADRVIVAVPSFAIRSTARLLAPHLRPGTIVVTDIDQARLDRAEQLFRQQADIKELTETVQRLAVALEKQNVALESTKKTVGEVKADVDEIKGKPAKRWDAVIAALIAGVAGYVLARLGLK